MTRRFLPVPLDLSEVVDLLDVARRAPSAGFAQGSAFVVLAGDEVGDFFAVSGAGEWFADRAPGVLAAPVVVLALADPRRYLARYQEQDKDGHGLGEESGWSVPHWLTDTALAVQQVLLLAEDRGWGALYAGLFRNVDLVRSTYGIPGEVIPIGFVALGHRDPADVASGSPRRRPRRPLDEVVHRGRWHEAGSTPHPCD